jgi:hypothetical protein
MAMDRSIVSDEYFRCAIMNIIFTEVPRRRSNAHVAHSIIKATVSIITLEFMERFMDEVAEKGRLDSGMPWDKEGLRDLSKSFKDSKSWFFTTFGSVAFLASVEEPDALIRDNEVAFGL